MFQHDSAEFFEDNLLSYRKFNHVTEVYDDFIQKNLIDIDKVVPIEERRIKHNSPELFDSEVSEAIRNPDRLLRKFKKSALHIDVA